MIRSWRLLAFIALISVVILSCKQDNIYGDVAESQSPVLTPHYDSVNENIPGYYSGLPARYEMQLKSILYPVIICFHGAGGFGHGFDELPRAIGGVVNLLKKKNIFPASFLVDNKVYSFIVLAPQFKDFPTNNDIKSFIEYAKLHYSIDVSRIYLAGVSVGGRMACDYAAEFPNEIAALVAMSGCSNPDDSLQLKCKNIIEANLPVWVFHNRDDEAWPVSAQIKFVSTIGGFSPTIEPRLTIFDIPAGLKNHDAWTRATNPDYRENGINIYEWMLKFKR